MSAAAYPNLPAYGTVKYSLYVFYASFFYVIVHSTKLHDVGLNYLNKTTEIHAAYKKNYFMMKEPNERANKRHAKAKIQQYLQYYLSLK